jgi:hypothetical protein
MIKHDPININDKFGNWLVLSYGPMKYTSQTYVCQCSCGKRQTVIGTNLRSGRSTRCLDCYNKDPKAKNFKHGKASTFKGKELEGLGTKKSFEEWARHLQISEMVLRKYLRKGLTIDSIQKTLIDKSGGKDGN